MFTYSLAHTHTRSGRLPLFFRLSQTSSALLPGPSFGVCAECIRLSGVRNEHLCVQHKHLVTFCAGYNVAIASTIDVFRGTNSPHTHSLGTRTHEDICISVWPMIAPIHGWSARDREDDDQERDEWLKTIFTRLRTE